MRVFSPDVKYGFVCELFWLVASLDLEVEHPPKFGVSRQLYFHGDLDKNYMEHLKVSSYGEGKDYVCRSEMFVRVEASTRQWYKKFELVIGSKAPKDSLQITVFFFQEVWPDLAHAVGVVSRFLSNLGKKHWEAIKLIFRYLRGTSKLGITFGNGKPMLVGFTDSDMAGNKDNMKSTSGYLMTFAGGAVL
ncbi:hypothetical protein Tco_0060499 [Tanacetum coccineum]